MGHEAMSTDGSPPGAGDPVPDSASRLRQEALQLLWANYTLYRDYAQRRNPSPGPVPLTAVLTGPDLPVEPKVVTSWANHAGVKPLSLKRWLEDQTLPRDLEAMHRLVAARLPHHDSPQFTTESYRAVLERESARLREAYRLAKAADLSLRGSDKPEGTTVPEGPAPHSVPASAEIPGGRVRAPRPRHRRLTVLLAVAAVLVTAVTVLVISRHERAGDASRAKPFGLSKEVFLWSAHGSELELEPPTTDPYKALWGVLYSGRQRCSVTVSFDVQSVGVSPLDNFGFGVAPRATVIADQPAGDSVQYEHAVTPGDAATTRVRAVQLPGGAFIGSPQSTPAPALTTRPHIEVQADGSVIRLLVNGTLVLTTPSVDACGAIAIRAWGASFTFDNLKIS